MTTFIIATRNAHKVEEIRGILGAGFRFLTLRDFPAAPPVVEDAETFAGNAVKKAAELARWLAVHHPGAAGDARFVLADDSGLEVDALDGAPGVHSARFAAPDARTAGNTPDGENNAKLLRLLHEVPAERRGARFRCVIAVTPVGGSAADATENGTRLFDGVCEGRIAMEASGAGGFGYDPLFVPAGFAQSFAELGEEIKNGISHRAHALEKLRAEWVGH
jgi:XTP/dITP diphosphohydrolase